MLNVICNTTGTVDIEGYMKVAREAEAACDVCCLAILHSTSFNVPVLESICVFHGNA